MSELETRNAKFTEYLSSLGIRQMPDPFDSFIAGWNASRQQLIAEPEEQRIVLDCGISELDLAKDSIGKAWDEPDETTDEGRARMTPDIQSLIFELRELVEKWRHRRDELDRLVSDTSGDKSECYKDKREIVADHAEDLESIVTRLSQLADSQGEWPPQFEGWEFVRFTADTISCLLPDDLYALSGDAYPLLWEEYAFNRWDENQKVGYICARGPLYRRVAPPLTPKEQAE